jgi:hypothetical protein
LRFPPWRLVAGGLAWLLALAGLLAALQRPSPLFVNLGAGDAAFARGFRGGWERDGLRQTGETMFHWTEDGSRLEAPVEVLSGRLTARLRLARFSDTPAEITLFAGDRLVDRWVQAPRGWMIRTIDLGEVRGPLRLLFRSESPSGEALGVALDWVEVSGAGGVLPSRSLVSGIAALLVGAPAALGLFLGFAPALAVAVGLLALAAAAVGLDRLGGLVALAAAGFPASLVTLGLGLAHRLLRRARANETNAGLALPAAASVLALVALSHPFYYYPDVDTHAGYLAAVRASPSLAWDQGPFQSRTGAWTREIAGQRIAFPYSPVFHLLALPLAAVFGEVAAVKTVAVLAFGLTLLAVHALGLALGLGATGAVLAQIVLSALPVCASRLTLALYPTLLGQALELLLALHLARRFGRLDGLREARPTLLFLLLAQAGYAGSIVSVGVVTLAFATLEAVAGERRRALRLLTAYAATAALVLAVMYGRFLPILLRDVLPHATEASSPARTVSSVLAAAVQRLAVFYDAVYPLLLLPGLIFVRKAPEHARRVVAAMLLAGVALLVMRFAAPPLFRDVKEVELLAGPVALVAAAALLGYWRRGRLGRLVALITGLGAIVWGASTAAAFYGERFLAAGR